MSNDNTLPEELKAEIKGKAHRSADAEEKRLKQKSYTYDRMVTRVNGYLCGHIAGATEYASKLHLLQQEYDKLKGENEKTCHELVNLAKQYKASNDLAVEHAALKEKAEKMAGLLKRSSEAIDSLQEVGKTGMGNFLRAEIDEFLSSYNSQTNNKNENNG